MNQTLRKISAHSVAGLVLALVLAACATESSSENELLQKPRAVEVGNPEDSRPGKPAQPKPVGLVQVDLQTTDLEEISQIKFAVEAVKLMVRSPGGKDSFVASNNLKAGAELILAPRNTQSISFSVPIDLLESKAELKIEMKLVSEKPGIVKANDRDHEIPPQTAPLILPLTGAQGQKTREQHLVITKIVNKSELFEPSVPEDPRRGVVSTMDPIDRQPYKLKGSQ